MAGGIWKSQNKVRPGAYINFKAVSSPSSGLGERGIVTMPVSMTWGPQKSVIELFSTDLADGSSLKKIGYTADDVEAQVYKQALSNCYKALIYRADVGGVKATATLGDVSVSAKYFGTTGNNISVAVVENANDDTKWDVITYFNLNEQHIQTIDKTDEVTVLEDNDWVEWSGSGTLSNTIITPLTGGTNGTVSSTLYTGKNEYLSHVSGLIWNTMAIPQEDAIVTEEGKQAVINYIKELRETQGKKVQAVLYNVTSNYEGIISVRQGYKTVDETITPEIFTAYVAGLTAGSPISVSNTYKVIEGAVEIVYPEGQLPYTNTEIIKLLGQGQLILTTRQDGAIVIEQDINTLHSPYPSTDVNYSFTKNRVIRTLDEIGNRISLLFETAYIGKVSNDTNGRDVFKADIISYLNQIQSVGAITNFDATADLTVAPGTDIDSIIVTLAIQPVDSMEKLYTTINVG